jgi:hypothetical protein
LNKVSCFCSISHHRKAARVDRRDADIAEAIGPIITYGCANAKEVQAGLRMVLHVSLFHRKIKKT